MDDLNSGSYTMLADFVLLRCGFFIRPTISFKNNIDKVSTLRDSLGSNMPKLNTENSNLGRRINLIKSHFRNSRSIMSCKYIAIALLNGKCP